MSKSNVSMTVNGKAVSAEVEPRTLLIHYLRENLGLTGPHIGCDTTHCGACTVDIDGKSVKSCTIFAVQAEGAEVLTIEGMAAADGKLHALQEGFREMHGLQCGYCTPGMIVRAHRLLQENPNPTEAEIRMGISGNLCRCTGYQNIVKAIQYAAAKINGVEYQGSRGMNAPTAPTSLERAEKLQGMGCKRKRVEDVRFTQGRGNYVDDIKLPGMLHGDFHRSSHAHARIVKIDTSKAKAVPGVVAVLTAEDLKGVNLAWMPTLAGDVQMVLADGKVLFQNQEIAFVVATDRYIAADAADLVEVEYEELPVRHRSVQGDGRGRAGPARGHQGQERRRARPAQASQPHLQLAGRRQGTDRRRLRQGRGRDQGPAELPARAPLPARNLPVRRQLQQDHGRNHDLRHVPGAARHPHRGRADLRPARAEDPRHFARHRRRLRQQGRRLSRLYLLRGRLDRHGPSGQMGRGPHREPLDHLVRARLSHDDRDRRDAATAG